MVFFNRVFLRALSRTLSFISLVLLLASCTTATVLPKTSLELSRLLRLSDARTPQQIHISLATETTRAVGWVTFEPPCSRFNNTHECLPPSVQWGTESGRYLFAANASTSQYYRAFHHDALITVSLGMPTFYRVSSGGSADAITWSPEFSFSATSFQQAPAFTAAIFGDMGVNNSDGTMALLMSGRSRYSFVLHNGDISYADDINSHLYPSPSPSSGPAAYEDVYDFFVQRLQPIAAEVPIMVAPGNHDVTCHILTDLGCAHGQRNFGAFNHRWRMPCEESRACPQQHPTPNISSITPSTAPSATTLANSRMNMWHSFRMGSAVFVVIDTETDYSGAPTTPHNLIGGSSTGFSSGRTPQLKWLDETLTAARQTPGVDWVIVAGHRPLFAGRSVLVDWPVGQELYVRRAFAPILYNHSVDLYIAAHVHWYQRLHSLTQSGEVCDSARTAREHCMPHIIHGSAGNNEPLNQPGSNARTLVAFGDYTNRGLLELQVFNSTMAEVRFIRASDGQVADRLVLRK